MAFYWIAALIITAVSAGVGFVSGLLRPRKTMQTRPAAEAPWVDVLPAQPRPRRLWAAVFVLATSGVPLVVLSIKLGCSGALNSGGQAFVVLTGAIVLAELSWLGAAVRARPAGEVRLAIDRATLKREEDVTFRIAVPLTQPSAPTVIAARVVCIERAVVHQGRFVHVRHQIVREMPLSIPVESIANGQAAGSTTVRFAEQVWPKSGPGKSLNFYYTWQMELGDTVFPLTVL